MGLVAKFSIPDVHTGPQFAGFVGNAGGWTRFGAWADELSLEEYGEIVRLWEHSYVSAMDDLESQLRRGLANDAKPLQPAGREVAESLLDILKDRGKAEVIIICDEYAEVPASQPD